ncbi:MAG: hypothetical protein OIF50_02915 [Flavobacteriaceae bacterium]|nr:hypothetical protein [Flavobacteriaceae bacterium]
MAKLEKNKQQIIDEIILKGSELHGRGNWTKSLNLLKQAWSELPLPKEDFDESFHIAKFITITYMYLKDYEEAKAWAQQTSKCDPERGEIGEKEFLIGQVYYEAEEYEKAIQFFNIADRKSDGMCFEGQDEKYKNLIL